VTQLNLLPEELSSLTAFTSYQMQTESARTQTLEQNNFRGRTEPCISLIPAEYALGLISKNSPHY
jgi:hypothetical protein